MFCLKSSLCIFSGDKNVLRTVQSLQKLQLRQEIYARQERDNTIKLIQRTYPWLVQNNTAPNRFLHATSATSHRPEPVAQNQNSVVVFLHDHRSAGTEIKHCMDQISKKKALASSRDMTSQERLRWDSGESFEGKIKDKLKFHKGKFAFGMCDTVGVPCSYFTMLRDPMTRAVSSYNYCKQALGDELCGVVNANKVTLRDWILHHGSLMFRQMLYRSDTCENDYNVTLYNLTDTENLMDPSQLPCWYKHKISMATIDDVELRQLSDYVVENLDKWFSVIGILEEFHDSVKMFEHVYKLPFTKCANLRQFSESYSHDNESNNNSNRRKRQSEYDDNDPEYLTYDPEVRNALDADYRIYRKARSIFNIQKQILLNKTNR